ncbi:MAG: hypothetical protein ABIZ52_02610, partial [Candidatus Limnocylindrales bacterium]
PECAPVTGASEVTCNRLWTAPLAAMFLSGGLSLRAPRGRTGRLAGTGLVIVTLGFGLMAAGNGGEYWLASHLPHEGPDGWVRGLLWMTVLLGWLAVLIGSTALGGGVLRSRTAPVWLGIVLAAAFPLTIALAQIALPALPVGIVGIAVGTLARSIGASDASTRPAESAAPA